jgi:hypothetical protein
MDKNQSTNECHKPFNPIRNVEKLLEIRPKLRVYDPGNSENNPNTQENNFNHSNIKS